MRTNFKVLGALAILVVALMFSAAPALAQRSVHVETVVTNITDSNFTYGPPIANCDPVKSGPECKFVSFAFKGTCENRSGRFSPRAQQVHDHRNANRLVFIFAERRA